MAGNPIARMRLDPAAFRLQLKIEVGGQAVPFPSVVRPWQNADFVALDESWKKIAGVSYRDPAPLRAVMLRARGGSKSADIAVSSLWALWAARTAVTGIAGAGSREQASHILRRIRTLLSLNPFLASSIEMQRDRVINAKTGSELMIVSSDAALGYGWLVDFILADELCHWPLGSGQEFWSMLLSTASKRDCLLAVLTNAGTIGSWQHTACLALQGLDNCHYSQTDENETLMKPSQVEELRLTLPPIHYDRYVRNQWTRPIQDAIDEALIKQCETNRYRYPIDPSATSSKNYLYVGGFDLSATADNAAATIIAVNLDSGVIRLAWSRRFAPRDGKIDLLQVVAAIREANRKYRPISWHADQFESRRLAQEMARDGARVVIESFQGANAARMASALLTALNANQLELHTNEPGMLQDLRSVSIVERGGVLRVVADRDSRGHSDQIYSLITCLPVAQELVGRNYRGDREGGTGISRTHIPVDPSRHGVQVEQRSMSQSKLAIGQDPLASFRQRQRGGGGSSDGWRKVEF